MRFRSNLSIPHRTSILSLVIVGFCLFIGQQAIAMTTCPFCSAVALTFTETINQQQVAVVAKLIEKPEPPTVDSYDFPDGKFEIVGVLKGKDVVNIGMTFKTQVVGVYPVGQKFLIMGQGAPDISWTAPIKANERVFDYLKEIRELPESGPDRLVFFQQFFEDKNKILAVDAYDEFAAASYEDLITLKDKMQREKLLKFIKSPKTTINRRRLYFTMLGICGQPEDVEFLEGLIKSDNRKQQAGLDALVGCYLTLNGKKGLPLIEEKFLANKDADYVDLTNVMEALRFMATETDVLSTDDIIPAVRKILDNSEHADIVIEDLARWGDWSVMEKLVERFKSVNEEDTWQRVPILSYLLECPKPEAKEYIKELKKIDPQSFERASFYRNIGDIDDDDDWGDGDVPVANQPPPVDADSDQESKENASKDEDDDSPTTMPATDDTSAAPIAPTIFRDDQVKTAAAEVDLVIDDVDATKKQIELTRVSQSSHLLDEPEPFVETELADVLMVNPKATDDAPPKPLPEITRPRTVPQPPDCHRISRQVRQQSSDVIVRFKWPQPVFLRLNKIRTRVQPLGFRP